MKKAHILLALMAAAALAGSAQSTSKLTASRANDFGIAYSLPNTVFDIVIETQITEKLPGEFANFANRFLNITDAITQPTFEAEVLSVTVVPKGIPNEESRWMLEFKGSGLTYMMLNEAGVPVSINYEDIKAEDLAMLPVSIKSSPTALETNAAKHALTQEMIASTSLSKRAQLVAQRIFDLRETRSDLISGNAENTPPDGKSMQLMLDNLAAQEEALTAMFIGTVRKTVDVQTLTFTPGDEEVRDLIIGRISPTKGLVGAEDLSGKPIYLSMDVIATGEIPTDAAGAPKKAPKDGVAYNIPGTAQLTITYDGKTLLSRDYEVAQLGKVFYLDPKIFTDKKAPAYAIFNPITGGILNIGTRQAQ